jgi:hypothetical protein
MCVAVCQENWVAELVEAYENGRITDHRWSVRHSVFSVVFGKSECNCSRISVCDSMVAEFYDLRFSPRVSSVLVKVSKVLRTRCQERG